MKQQIEMKTEKIKADYFSQLEKEVLDKLNQLNITYTYVTNEIVETMDECAEINQALDCEVRKSILLTNKKQNSLFLVVLPSSKNLDIKQLEKKLGLSFLSFASKEQMEEKLGVIPGSLTVLSVLKDIDDYVTVLLDKEITEVPFFACNTTDNRRHIKMKTADLTRYLKDVHHRPTIIFL